MELRVGDRFSYNNYECEVVESNDCVKCILKGKVCEQHWKNIGECSPYKRKDGKRVKFIKVD